MGLAARRISIPLKIFNKIMQLSLMLGLLACAGKDGGVGGSGLGGGSLDLGGANPGAGDGDSTVVTTNQASGSGLDAGNIAPGESHDLIFLMLDCSQSLGLKKPDFGDISDEAPQEFSYLIKAQAPLWANNFVAQIVDRDKNQFMYAWVNGAARFEFEISLDSDPYVQFYNTKIEYDATSGDPAPVTFDTWKPCTPGICPQPAWPEMHRKLPLQYDEPDSCAFLKSKPPVKIDLQKIQSNTPKVNLNYLNK
jgi:hypothetical protein